MFSEFFFGVGGISFDTEDEGTAFEFDVFDFVLVKKVINDDDVGVIVVFLIEDDVIPNVWIK